MCFGDKSAVQELSEMWSAAFTGDWFIYTDSDNPVVMAAAAGSLICGVIGMVVGAIVGLAGFIIGAVPGLFIGMLLGRVLGYVLVYGLVVALPLALIVSLLYLCMPGEYVYIVFGIALPVLLIALVVYLYR
ncbi:MAG TPA: hypothetical protein DCL60_12395 [Armatimonadetes bacterium]|nr:hypothetical protein [Armatimonadota bacterium]